MFKYRISASIILLFVGSAQVFGQTYKVEVTPFFFFQDETLGVVEQANGILFDVSGEGIWDTVAVSNSMEGKIVFEEVAPGDYGVLVNAKADYFETISFGPGQSDTVRLLPTY